MANSNPSPSTRFGCGNNANPKGAGARNGELRALQKLNGIDFIQVANSLLKCTADEVRRISKDPNAPALQASIAAVILRIIDKGDMGAFDMFLNRIIGKPRDSELLEPEEGTNSTPQVIVTLPSNMREVR